MKSEVKFIATNPGGEPFSFKSTEWEGEWPKLESRMDHAKMDIDVKKSVPVRQFAAIRAIEGSKTIFRGYVEFPPEIRGGRRTLLCVGYEKLFNDRVLPNYFYPAEDVTLGQIFSHTLTDGQVPGLLALINGALPAGWDYTIYDADYDIVKLPGLGRASPLWKDRAVAICGYDSLRALDKMTAPHQLEYFDESYYQDDADLFVRISDSKYESGWPDMGGLVIDRWADTTCRMGSITGSTDKLRGDLQIGPDTKPGDLYVNLARGHGYYLHLWYDSNYTHITIDEEEGRGLPDGLFKLHQRRCTKFDRKAGSDPRAHSLTGVGEGYQYYTKADTSYQGPWRHRSYDVLHGFKDSLGFLKSHTDAKFEDLQTDWQRHITTFKQITIRPGDFICAVPNQGVKEILSCEKLKRRSSGERTLILGKPSPRFADSWEIFKDSIQGFTDKTMWPSNLPITGNATFYPRDPAHAGTQASISVTIPDKVKDTKLNPMITLTPSISYNTNKIPISQRASFIFQVQSNRLPPLIGVTPGTPLKSYDVTSYVTEDASNVVKCDAIFAKNCDGTHSDYTGHPQLRLDIEVGFWKRMAIT